MSHPLPSRRFDTSPNIPLKVAMLYALFGAFWILLSDRLLDMLVHDRATMTRISVYKGWAFIAITAWLLYRLILRDYRKLQEAGALIRESEERYRTLFENTSAVILLVDPVTADIVDANSAAASFYGYGREELIGMKTTALNTLSPEQVMDNLREARRASGRVERRHRLKSGEIRDVEVYRGPIEIGARSNLFAIVHDITERKRVEEQLRDNENKLRAITEAGADAIILVDDGMRVTYWNGAAERMFGRMRGEVLGETIDCIVPERHRDAHIRGFRRFIASGAGVLGRTIHEVCALRHDGTEFPGELSLAGVQLMGKWHAAGIVRDVSERKNLEGQLRHAQKMQAIGTLTGGIAHDFNNALTAVTGFGSLLRTGVADNELLASYADNILTAADRAANLTRSLLTFSSSKPIEPKLADLNEIVETGRKFLSRLLREDILFQVEKFRDPLLVMVDPGQVVQMLMNFAVNAEDAMPGGGESSSPFPAKTSTKGFPGSTGTAFPEDMPSFHLPIPAPGWSRKRGRGSSTRFSPRKGWGRGPVWGCRRSTGS